MVRQDRIQSYGCWYTAKDLMASYIVVMVSFLTLRICRRKIEMERVDVAVDICRLEHLNPLQVTLVEN